jgi:hypothetical protein
MGSEDNRFRKKWQDYSGENAGIAEQDFFEAFQKAFLNTEYEIVKKPKDFANIYIDVVLPLKTLDAIYTPNSPIKRHGVFPDYAIQNKKTSKTIYIEVKRQDGWVEGKQRKDGRGNAHERSCKFFTPGLLKIMRQAGKIHKEALPFWTVFLGDITRDPCRVREITCWYDEYKAHFFFWRNTQDPLELFEHFTHHISPLLE